MQSIEDLTESFALLDDWEGRYGLLIDLGKELPPLDDSYKTDTYLVRGCTSRVWLVPAVKEGRLTFTADSDAHLVRGLIALLFIIYNNRPIAEVATVDIEDIFRKLGLAENLTPNRRNGFFAMVERIKSFSA